MSNHALPPLESTVRIVPGDVRIWSDAEQFVGADCTLKAVFMTGDTQMVAVEHIENGVCCCFWSSMVRTPEQIAAEEKRVAIDQTIKDLKAVNGCGFYSIAEDLYDAGYRKQVTQ